MAVRETGNLQRQPTLGYNPNFKSKKFYFLDLINQWATIKFQYKSQRKTFKCH